MGRLRELPGSHVENQMRSSTAIATPRLFRDVTVRPAPEGPDERHELDHNVFVAHI